MAVVVDASVVIAFLDPSDSVHDRAVAGFANIGDEQIVLPASALAEVLAGAHRQGAAAVRIIGSFLEEAGIRIEPITAEIARTAAALRARHTRIGLPDAFVLATGEHLGARSIITADRAWRGVVARVRVI